mmetsp:Transcript_15830/g.18387  ORF Transcript_15830/g.18387 Transcript_15830/m.18387 type:complete len:352 (-) Transcript_15830:428-1483(-)
MTRFLYNSTYLNSNCTLPYDDTSSIDNLSSTLITNYALASVGIVAALSVWFASPGKRDDLWMTVFFSFFGLGKIIVSIEHSIVDLNDPSFGGLLVLTIAHDLIVLSHSALLFCGLRSLTKNAFLRDAWLVVSAVVIVLVSFKYFILSMFWGMVVSTFMVCVYVSQCVKRMAPIALLKALGMSIAITGSLTKIILGQTCGTNAYKSCFEFCPLPDASIFNQNGLYHIMTILGIATLAIAEVKHPSSSMFVGNRKTQKQMNVSSVIYITEQDIQEISSVDQTTIQGEEQDRDDNDEMVRRYKHSSNDDQSMVDHDDEEHNKSMNHSNSNGEANFEDDHKNLKHDLKFGRWVKG